MNNPGKSGITNLGAGFLSFNSMPPRVHIASDDPEFDEEYVSNLRAEGFETNYIPLLPPPNGRKLDLTPLRHVADDLELGESYAIIAFGAAATACLDFYSSTQPHCCALIAYYPTAISNPTIKFPPSLQTTTHLAASQNFAPAFPSYTYNNVQPGFAESDLDEYDRLASSLSWSRTLATLRKAFKIEVDLERVWEEHVALEFATKDAAATMRTMVAQQPYVNHVPTLTGGIGQKDLFVFYRDYFIPSNPPSTQIKLVSRTIGVDRVVDEMIFSFDHTQAVPWMLPDVPPTGKHVSVALVAIVCIRGGKLYHEHIYWDQASVLVQVGLLDPKLVPKAMKDKGLERLPVVGAESARKVLDESSEPSNELLSAWKLRPNGDPGVKMPERPKQARNGD